MSLRLNKDGYYIIDSNEKLKEWYRMTDLSHTERLALKGEMGNPIIKKTKPTKKSKKIVEKPEQTEFDKWFNFK